MTHTLQLPERRTICLIVMLICTTFISNAQCLMYYADNDEDGHGDKLSISTKYCSDPGLLFSLTSDDCDDNNQWVNPGATEICNDIDDNCNGSMDEGFTISPIITYTASTHLCSGDSLELLVNSGIGSSYQWLRNGVEIEDGLGSSYWAAETGAYQVRVNSSYGCSATSTQINVVSFPYPEAIITPVGNKDICVKGKVKLKCFSTAGVMYRWYKDGVELPGAHSANYIANSPGSYAVELTNYAGCSDMSNATVIYSSCRIASKLANGLNISPNPARNTFKVTLNTGSNYNGVVTISLFNAFGSLVYSQSATMSGGQVCESVPLTEEIVAGIYIVKITTAIQEYSGQVVILD